MVNNKTTAVRIIPFWQIRGRPCGVRRPFGSAPSLRCIRFQVRTSSRGADAFPPPCTACEIDVILQKAIGLAK